MAPFDQALKNLSQYHWLVFTSANGVAAFMARLFEQGQDVRALGGLKIAAIGPATAESLRAYGLMADVVPPAFKAEVLLEALGPQVTPGAKMLLARAQIAREVLPEGLVRLGAKVDVAPVYKSRLPQRDSPGGRSRLARGPGGYPHLHQLRHGA